MSVAPTRNPRPLLILHVSSPRLPVRLTDSKSTAPLNRVRLHKSLLHLHPKSTFGPKSDPRGLPQNAVSSSDPKSKLSRLPKTVIFSPHPKSDFSRPYKFVVFSPDSKSDFSRQRKIVVFSPHPKIRFLSSLQNRRLLCRLKIRFLSSLQNRRLLCRLKIRFLSSLQNVVFSPESRLKIRYFSSSQKSRLPSGCRNRSIINLPLKNGGDGRDKVTREEGKARRRRKKKNGGVRGGDSPPALARTWRRQFRSSKSPKTLKRRSAPGTRTKRLRILHNQYNDRWVWAPLPFGCPVYTLTSAAAHIRLTHDT